jgi:ATP-binding cassette, subfamily B, bacterial MsbA
LKLVLRILSYLRPYKVNLVLASIAMFIFVIFNLASVILIIPFIDVLFGGAPPVAMPQPELTMSSLKEWARIGMDNLMASVDPLTALKYLCLMIMGSFIFKNFFHYLQIWFMAPAEQGIIRDLRTHLYEHLNRLSLGYFAGEKKGQLMSRIINDVKLVNDSALAVVNSIFRDPPQIISYTIFLFILDWKLTLLAFLILPVTAIILAKIGDYLRRQSHKMQESLANLTSVIEEGLSSMRIIKAFRMEKYEIKKFQKHNQDYYRTHVKIHRRKELYSPLTETLSALVVVLILWFMGASILSKESGMSSGEFIAFIFAMLQLMQPLKYFGQMLSGLATGMAGAQRIFEVLDIEPKIVDKPEAREITAFESKIEYRGVSFKYDEGDKVFTDLNAEIYPGQLVAIVGSSGVGKTTMADMLPRFYDVVGGGIYIDGVDIRDVTVESLRSLMGIVTQETLLFNTSIKDNIAYGDQSLPMDAIIEAAKAANAHDFIMESPLGYETIIGDRGVKLSGGQRQRLSIARAILKNPPILILDEATSSLDTESEQLVQQAIENLMMGRTSVVIAHRLSTIQRADVIYVLHDGQVKEKGTHKKLMENAQGLYHRLYELQFQVNS